MEPAGIVEWFMRLQNKLYTAGQQSPLGRVNPTEFAQNPTAYLPLIVSSLEALGPAFQDDLAQAQNLQRDMAPVESRAEAVVNRLLEAAPTGWFDRVDRYVGVARNFCPVCDQPFEAAPAVIGVDRYKCPHCGATVSGSEIPTARDIETGAAPTPGYESRAQRVVNKVLEHCGHCGTPTKVTLKPQKIDLDRVPASEKRKGTKVEKEHVVKAKDALAVAAGHWKEQTDQKKVPPEEVDYYRQGEQKGLFPELSRPKSYLAGIDSLGL